MEINELVLSPKVKAFYIHESGLKLAPIALTLFEKKESDDTNNYKLTLIKRRRKKRATYKLEFEGEVYYLKKFHSKEERIGLVKPRGLSCFLVSLELSAAGFTVAEPVLALTYQSNLVGKESIFIAKKSNGVNLKELLTSNLSSGVKEQALDNFTSTLGNFFGKGFIQSDPNSSNFLINFLENNFEIVFIDLETVFHRTFLSRIFDLKIIARMCCSLYRYLFDFNLYSREKLALYLNNILSKSRIKDILFIRKKMAENLAKWEKTKETKIVNKADIEEIFKNVIENKFSHIKELPKIRFLI